MLIKVLSFIIRLFVPESVINTLNKRQYHVKWGNIMLNILLCVVFFLFIFAGFKFTGAIMSALSAIALFIFTPWFTIPLISLLVIAFIYYREIE